MCSKNNLLLTDWTFACEKLDVQSSMEVNFPYCLCLSANSVHWAVIML